MPGIADAAVETVLRGDVASHLQHTLDNVTSLPPTVSFALTGVAAPVQVPVTWSVGGVVRPKSTTPLPCTGVCGLDAGAAVPVFKAMHVRATIEASVGAETVIEALPPATRAAAKEAFRGAATDVFVKHGSEALLATTGGIGPHWRLCPHGAAGASALVLVHWTGGSALSLEDAVRASPAFSAAHHAGRGAQEIHLLTMAAALWRLQDGIGAFARTQLPLFFDECRDDAEVAATDTDALNHMVNVVYRKSIDASIAAVVDSRDFAWPEELQPPAASGAAACAREAQVVAYRPPAEGGAAGDGRFVREDSSDCSVAEAQAALTATAADAPASAAVSLAKFLRKHGVGSDDASDDALYFPRRVTMADGHVGYVIAFCPPGAGGGLDEGNVVVAMTQSASARYVDATSADPDSRRTVKLADVVALPANDAVALRKVCQYLVSPMARTGESASTWLAGVNGAQWPPRERDVHLLLHNVGGGAGTGSLSSWKDCAKLFVSELNCRHLGDDASDWDVNALLLPLVRNAWLRGALVPVGSVSGDAALKGLAFRSLQVRHTTQHQHYMTQLTRNKQLRTLVDLAKACGSATAADAIARLADGDDVVLTMDLSSQAFATFAEGVLQLGRDEVRALINDALLLAKDAATAAAAAEGKAGAALTAAVSASSAATAAAAGAAAAATESKAAAATAAGADVKADSALTASASASSAAAAAAAEATAATTATEAAAATALSADVKADAALAGVAAMDTKVEAVSASSAQARAAADTAAADAFDARQRAEEAHSTIAAMSARVATVSKPWPTEAQVPSAAPAYHVGVAELAKSVQTELATRARMPSSGEQPRPAAVVVRGVAGAGKTSVAQQFVRLADAEGLYPQGVLWLNASSVAELQEEYRRVAVQQLGWKDLAVMAPEEVASRVFKLWRGEGADPETRWLLVLDNADTPRRLIDAGLLPSAGNVDVAITSRAGRTAFDEYVVSSSFVDVECLDKEQGARVLLLRARTATSTSVGTDSMEAHDEAEIDAARALSAELGGLPFVLVWAAATVSRNGETFASFVERYRLRHTHLFADDAAAKRGVADLRTLLASERVPARAIEQLMARDSTGGCIKDVYELANMTVKEVRSTCVELGFLRDVKRAVLRARARVDGAERPPPSVATLWSFDLTSLSPAALDFVQQLAWMQPDDIPLHVWLPSHFAVPGTESDGLRTAVTIETFKVIGGPSGAMSVSTGALHSCVTSAADHTLALREVVNELEDRSLLRTTPSDTVHVHRLLQQVVRDGTWTIEEGVAGGSAGTAGAAHAGVTRDIATDAALLRLLRAVASTGQAIVMAGYSLPGSDLWSVSPSARLAPHLTALLGSPYVRALADSGDSARGDGGRGHGGDGDGDEDDGVAGTGAAAALCWVIRTAAGVCKFLVNRLGGTANKDVRVTRSSIAGRLSANALALARRVTAESDAFEHIGVVALCLDARATVLDATGDTPAAMELMQEALEMQRQLEARRGEWAGHDIMSPLAIESALLNLALLYHKSRDFAGAEEMLCESIARAEHRNSPDDALVLANARKALADCYADQGRRLDDALRLTRLAVKTTRDIAKMRGIEDYYPLALALNSLGLVHHQRGEADEAERILKESLEMKRGLFGATGDVSVAVTLRNLALVLASDGRHVDATALVEEADTISTDAYGTLADSSRADAAFVRAAILLSSGQEEDGEKLLLETLDAERLRISGGPDVGSDCCEWAGVLSGAADAMQSAKLTSHADHLYVQALEIERRNHGGELHVHVHNVRVSLLYVLVEAQDFGRAEPLCEADLRFTSAREAQIGVCAVAVALRSLAAMRLGLKKHDEALDGLREALEKERSAHDGRAHAHILECLDAILVAKQVAGSRQDAIDAASEAVELHRELCRTGDADPRALAARLSELVKMHVDVGNAAAAEPLAVELVATYKEFASSDGSYDQLNVAKSLFNLGRVRDMQGRDEAEALYIKALSTWKAAAGDGADHDVWQATMQLGQYYEHSDRFEEAAETYESALDLQRLLHPRLDHADVALTMHGLALAADQKGDVKTAERNYAHALTIRQALCPSDVSYADVATSLKRLVGVRETLRPDAVHEWGELVTELVRVRRLQHGDDNHEDVASALSELGRICLLEGKIAGALDHFQQALDMRVSLHGACNHFDVAASLGEVGEMYLRVCDIAKAEEALRGAIAMMEALDSSRVDVNTARARSNFGMLFYRKLDIDRAVAELEKALDMRRRLHGDDDHGGLAQVLNNLGIVQLQAGRGDVAAPLLTDALDMRRRLYSGRVHAELEESLVNAANLHSVWPRGDRKLAADLWREAIVVGRAVHEENVDIAVYLRNLCLVLLMSSDVGSAGVAAHESAALFTRLSPSSAEARAALALLRKVRQMGGTAMSTGARS